MNPIIFKLLTDFLQIGLLSIGGGYAVIPLIKAHVVDLRNWLTVKQFTDIITISQMTPGPLAVNTSTFVGLKVAGIPGAIAATFGCVFWGFAISLMLLRFFNRYKSSKYVGAVLKGLKAASLGLIASAAATILVLAFTPDGTPGTGGFSVSGILTGFICLSLLIGIRRLKLSPIAAMVISGFVGFFVYT